MPNFVFKVQYCEELDNHLLQNALISVHFFARLLAGRNLKKYPIISGFLLKSSENVSRFILDCRNRPDTAMLSPKLFFYRRIFISTAKFLALNPCQSFCSAGVSA